MVVYIENWWEGCEESKGGKHNEMHRQEMVKCIQKRRQALTVGNTLLCCVWEKRGVYYKQMRAAIRQLCMALRKLFTLVYEELLHPAPCLCLQKLPVTGCVSIVKVQEVAELVLEVVDGGRVLSGWAGHYIREAHPALWTELFGELLTHLCRCLYYYYCPHCYGYYSPAITVFINNIDDSIMINFVLVSF